MLEVDFSDPRAVAIYYQTHPVPKVQDVAIIIASIVVSVLGAGTTLLLLSRRTATAGIRNWTLLLLAASTMGSVGIWGMHFIGMTMILRPTPDINWYIQYNPGFTVLSLLVPTFALVLAFVFVGTGPESLPVDENDESYSSNKEMPGRFDVKSKNFLHAIWRGNSALLINLRIIIGGLIVGGTVSLMHYSAGFGASFERKYNFVYLIFSIVLACFASTVSLLVFFKFQAQWQDNWWKKLICASGLATGVCGMHYLGLSGTEWYVPHEKTESFSAGKESSTILTISIGVMCFAVCILSFIIVISDFLVTRESRRKARRVVIVSATFDKSGRVLVNLDGMLPMCEVETDFPLKYVMEELNYRQSTFQWLYTLSWDWSILNPILPRIVARSLGLVSNGRTSPFMGGSQPKLRRGKEPGSSYSASKNNAQIGFFKDRCIEATQTLASQIGVPIDQMGVFFDNVLRTGTRVPTESTSNEKSSPNMRNDEEGSLFSVSMQKPRQQQGLMLFLVRELSGEQQDTPEGYAKRGYRFADIRWFAPVFADRAAVEKNEIDGLLEQLKLYAKRGTKPCVRSNGVYVGFFAVRPSISRQGGIDTLVYQFARHQIPAYRLPDVEKITDEMRAWVRTMSGRKMNELGEICLKEVDGSSPPPNGKTAEEMWIFKSSLVLAMDAMTANLKMFPSLTERALLSAEIVDVPSSHDDSTETASMIVFQTTVPAPARHGEELPGLAIQNEPFWSYKKQEPAPTFVFVPYTLFSKSQMMMLRATGAKKFARQVRAELSERYPASAQSGTNQIDTPATDLMSPYPTNTAPIKHASVQSPQNVISSNDGDDDDVYADLVYRYGSFEETPAQLEAKLARTALDDAGNLNPASKRNNRGSFYPTPPTAIASGQWRGVEYDGMKAPAYSDFPSKLNEGGAKRPDVGSPTKKRTMQHNISPERANNTSERENFKTQNLDVSQVSGHAAATQTRAQLLSSAARLRSDDWPTRCLDGLEQSEAGAELLGVQW
ncbi:hypothetical protein BY996DRAFT_4605576 [Phakopsora pachyrhizi]|uniref:MHYT domain-containing protein n=1 Tax=Phakopsora pachyrhizi TaxID=170000 RepID=A0AAV0AWV1_PHAPC|nr:hypothetical protein BY996DRAFT_4605576 [Phakopsora pachyrhizi]CAH7672393.1 hypothetical protein PPACK8108_LOCUS7198 [Phakopsora pachyrhizi]